MTSDTDALINIFLLFVNLSMLISNWWMIGRNAKTAAIYDVLISSLKANVSQAMELDAWVREWTERRKNEEAMIVTVGSDKNVTGS
jgi:hypothetical protein